MPRFLVIHYTASHGLEETLDWFTDPESRASAHFVVGRDGRIVQLVPLDRRAWHAGDSAWQGRVGMNAHAIGIELVNAGRLRASEAFYHATLGGAHALRLDDKIGNFVPGKEADFIVIDPAVGTSRPATIRSVVVLPQPEGPRSAKKLPCGIVRSSGCTAVKPLA